VHKLSSGEGNFALGFILPVDGVKYVVAFWEEESGLG